MTATDYQREVTVQTSREAVFAALTTGIHEWWTEDFSGSGAKAGDEFTVRFGTTFMTMRISALLPGIRLSWDCIDALTDLPELGQDKTEWIGTSIHWQLMPDESDVTRLRIVHEGLTPEVKCFNVCQQGWDFFLDSLRKVLEGQKSAAWKA